MSSRSFRRRNNRRRHRQGTGDDVQGQRPEGQPDEQQPGGKRARPPDGNPPVSGRGNPAPGARASQPAGRRGPSGKQSAGRGAEPSSPPWPVAPVDLPDCPVCGKQVRELASALTHRVARQPAHFDCVMRELRDANEITQQEKICYLGGGTFGILEFRPPGGPSRFVIRKRIQYEEKETPQDWKKILQISC